jgi:hypothetical protein
MKKEDTNLKIFIFFILMNGMLFGQQNGPTVSAPTPTVPADSVISLFSNAYTSILVDTWSADWDQADVTDTLIVSDDVKLYTNLVFAGIEFKSQTIDASTMTHYHMDIWTPDPTANPAVFRIKLVDFGADGGIGGDDDVEHELTFDENSIPALATGNWVSFDIPLSAFTDLTTTTHLGQLIISGGPNTVYVDNIYVYDSGAQGPIVPASTPTIPASDVISLFSNAYSNMPVDTWSADWDQADVTDVQIAGDDVKLYTNLVFAGILFSSQTIDVSTMTHFHIDIWTPDPTASPKVFKIMLVDLGANGVFGGDDDAVHELVFDENSTPALATGIWVSFDIPLSDFTDLTTREHLAQLIISGNPNTVYVDNIYFHSSATAVKKVPGFFPPVYTLAQNYPNPFNPTTTIEFDLPRTSVVILKIFNILGEEVATLVSDRLTAGTYSYEWSRPVGIASGVYLYRLSVGSLSTKSGNFVAGEAGDFIETKKMVLMR